MAKDPAFLFYFRDFLVSTELMTPDEVGFYTRILCHMADKGRLSHKHMLSICNSYDTAQALQEKFKIDENGLYYNTRLEEEVEKRKNYTQSRRNNAKTHDEHMPNHMGNANANVNAVKDNIKTKNTTATPKPKKQVTFVRDNPPTLEECTSYCNEKSIDPQQFHDANTAVGWVDKNKTPYRDWKAVVRKWANYRKATAPVVAAPPSKRPAAIVVLEKIAVGMDDRAIMQALVGTYSEHAITEALMQARGKVQ